MQKKAFTLIELLIVVAIIAILAAIAVPNFLEAQTRSKVSRIKADLRSIATAVEAYAVDHSRVPRQIHTVWYPEDNAFYSSESVGVYGILWWGLTTPIAYITYVDYIDPFQAVDILNNLDERRYTYHDVKAYIDHAPVNSTTQRFWESVYEFYGPWRMASVGPDKRYGHGFNNSAQLVYDPTNGTVSLGNIWRSQKQPDAAQPIAGSILINAH